MLSDVVPVDGPIYTRGGDLTEGSRRCQKVSTVMYSLTADAMVDTRCFAEPHHGRTRTCVRCCLEQKGRRLG